MIVRGRVIYGGLPAGRVSAGWLPGERANLRGSTSVAVPYVPPPHIDGIWAHADVPSVADVTPTYDGSGQATHPSVIDAGLGGLVCGVDRYVMAMTPYPGEVSTWENPSILVSPDGRTWSVPAGLTNPLIIPPTGWFCPDPDLIYDGTTLRCSFLGPYGSPAAQHVVYMESTDLVNWSAVDSLHVNTPYTVSPSIVNVGADWWMFSCTTTGNMVRRSAAAYTGPWSDHTGCSIMLPNGGEPWHIDVCADSTGTLWASVVEHVSHSLWLARSEDTGLTWVVCNPAMMIGSTGSFTWIYRTCLSPRGADVYTDGFDLWVSGYTAPNLSTYRIGYTTATVRRT